MGKNINLPIILGCYDKADKVAMWMKPKNISGRTLVVARLKDYVERGSQDISTRDLESICCELNFCKLEALRVFLVAASRAYWDWKEEEYFHHSHGEDSHDPYGTGMEETTQIMRHIMGNTPHCDECYWYTAKSEHDKDNWLDGWCRQEKEVKDWNQRDRMKTRANDRCRFWEDAEDRLTYYEVETRSPEAWRSDIEKCIIEKILDEDIRKARENK